MVTIIKKENKLYTCWLKDQKSFLNEFSKNDLIDSERKQIKIQLKSWWNEFCKINWKYSLLVKIWSCGGISDGNNKRNTINIKTEEKSETKIKLEIESVCTKKVFSKWKCDDEKESAWFHSSEIYMTKVVQVFAIAIE